MKLTGSIVTMNQPILQLNACLTTEAKNWLLHALLYRYTVIVLVPLRYEASSQVSTLKSITTVLTVMKQIDILISRNQVLQILYLIHHVYKAS